MPLRLRIGPFERLTPGQPAERTLTSGSLSIGRAADNDVVLADPERVISKHHCLIEGSRDSFRLSDTSVNGVYVNAEPEPIGRGRSHQLRDGDRLRIGAYEITVELGRAPALDVEVESGHEGEGPAEPLLGAFSSVTELFADELSPSGDRHRSRPPAERCSKPPRLTDLERGAPIDEAFVAPRGITPPATERDHEPPLEPTPHSGGLVIPTDWERPAAPSSPPAAQPAQKPSTPLAEIPEEWWTPQPKDKAAVPHAAVTPEAPAPIAVPPMPARPFPEPGDQPVSTTAPIGAFLRSAGLDPALSSGQPPEALLEQAGALVRLAVEGLIALLDARRAVKDTFRLESTRFRAVENNPLKFSADTETALAALLGPPQRGYLDGRAALSEAFADLRGHEMALLAGMQQVWRHLIGRFDPKALEARVGEDSGLGGLISSKKARCWDAFVTLHGTLAGSADDDLRLVERIFAEAYDSHVDRHQQGGRGSRRGGEM